jgi:glycosyltransferase involved in cell wall biosynthesis
LTRGFNFFAAKTGLGYSINLSDLLAKSIPDCDVSIATFCLTVDGVLSANHGKPAYHIQGWEPGFFSDVRMSNRARSTYYMPIAKFVNSTWLADKFKLELAQTLPIVCPGIDLSVFKPKANRLALKGNRLICLGKRTLSKGVFDLFEALRMVKKDVPSVELVLFGTDDYLAEYSPVKCTYVHAPSGEKLAELYSSCDALVMPSRLESFPLPPLEAMACGVPAVTTSAGVSDYAVDGINALIVEPRNPSQLASAIVRVLKDERLRESLISKGLETAKDFSWINKARILERILKQISERM